MAAGAFIFPDLARGYVKPRTEALPPSAAAPPLPSTLSTRAAAAPPAATAAPVLPPRLAELVHVEPGLELDAPTVAALTALLLELDVGGGATLAPEELELVLAGVASSAPSRNS